MPEQWMHDVMGDEATPRPGFEDRLAKELHREWHGDARRRWTTLVGAAAAVAAVVAAVVVFSGGDRPGTVTPATSTEATVDTSPDTSPDTTTGDTSVVTDPPASVKTVRVDESTPVLKPTLVWSAGESGPVGLGWSAAVTPSGRLFVVPVSVTTPQPVLEILADGSAEPIGVSVTGYLRSGPDERIYAIDAAGGRLEAITEVEPGVWGTAGTSTIDGGTDCRYVISPDEVRCGPLAVPVGPMAGPSVEIQPSFDVIVRTTQDGRFDQTFHWKMQLELGGGASLGDCTDDQCLTNRPFGDDGVLWSPVLETARTTGDSGDVAASLQLLSVMQPIGQPTVAWAQLSGQPAGVVGVVGNDVYLLSLTGAGANVEKVTMPIVPSDPALPDGIARPVKEYLSALNSGDYMAAAKLLGEGGLEWTARADLRPLYRPQFGLAIDDGSQKGLAAALARWCDQAYCGDIANLTLLDDRWVSAGPGNGHDGLFSVSVFEGQAGVQGLPLPIVRTPDRVVAETVLCPTDGVERTAWSDIDGDGWLELLVAQAITPPLGESGAVGYRVVACGTTTVMQPLELVGDSIRIYPVNPGATGADTLLIGFAEGYDNGYVYRFDGEGLRQQQRQGIPVLFGFRPYFPAAGTGLSVGCGIVPSSGEWRLISYEFTVDDKGVTYQATDTLTGEPIDSETMSPGTASAVLIQTGYCNGLPVQGY